LFAERQLVGQERRLTFAAYAAFGGLTGAIEQTAEAALAALSEAERETLPRLLHRLAVSVQGGKDFAIRCMPLAAAAPDAATRRLVEALVGARILVLTTERGGPTIRLAHLQAIERWPRARALLADGHEFADARSKIRKPAWRWDLIAAAALVLLATFA